MLWNWLTRTIAACIYRYTWLATYILTRTILTIYCTCHKSADFQSDRHRWTDYISRTNCSHDVLFDVLLQLPRWPNGHEKSLLLRYKHIFFWCLRYRDIKLKRGKWFRLPFRGLGLKYRR